MVTVSTDNLFNNGTVSAADLESAGAAITGGYHGDSLTLLVLIIFFPALSMYNALELIVLIFFTFNKYKGLYFWSLLIASAGIIPYSLGFLFKFGNVTEGEARWSSVVLLTIGWWTMVTGQSVVLWSRLHLILEGERGRRQLCWTKWMIIIDAFILHLPTTILTFGSNGSIDTENFAMAYNIMEKIQMSGFFLQEVILSSIYIAATLRILRTSVRDNTKKLMWQLLGINIIIITMDLGLLGLEAASLYLLETLIKGVIYSIKLKLEFAILGQLVKFVGRPGNSLANEERVRRASVAYFGQDGDEKTSRDTLRSSEVHSGLGSPIISDFAMLTSTRTNNTHTSVSGKSPDVMDGSIPNTRHRTRSDGIRLPPGMTVDDVDVAMFQHTDFTSLTHDDTDIEAIGSDNVSPSIVPEKTRFNNSAT